MPSRSPGHVILLVVLGLLGTVLAAAADPITWTGAVNGSWHDPGNWDLGRAPGPGDDVVIPDLPGTASVTYAAGSTSIQSLACDEVFVLSGGTLDIAGTSTIGNAFTLSGTTTVLTGAGNVTINGSFTWSGGTLSGSGTTKIGSASVWTVSGPGAVLTRLLESEGQGSHAGSTVTVTSPGMLRVRPGGVFVLPLDGTAFSGTGAIQVQTGALLRRDTGSGTCALACVLVNAGTVRAETGTLQFTGGLTNGGRVENLPGRILLNSNIGLISLAGSTLNAGGQIRFAGGNSVMDATVNLSVTGTLSIGGSGTLTLGQDLSVPSLVMDGGTLTGTGHLTATAACSWTGGTMSGAGVTTIPAGVSWTLGSNGVTTLSRTLENSGACTTAGFTSLTVINPGVFINRSGGTVDMLSATLFAGTGQVRNETGAIIRKTVGVGAGSISCPLVNDGLLRLETGTLRVTAAVTNNGTIENLSGSLFRVSTSLSSNPGSALTIGGNLTFDLGTSSIAAGASAVVSGFLTISSATVSFDANCTTAALSVGSGAVLQGSGLVAVGSSFDWSGGTMTGSGTTTVAPGAFWSLGAGPTTLARLLVNNGTCNYTGAASMTIAPSGTLRIASGGVLDLRSDASFSGNAGAIENLAGGLVRRTTSAGRFTLASPLVNSGEVRVLTGSLRFSANLVNQTGALVHGLAGTHVEIGEGTHSIGAGSTLDADDDLLFVDGTTTVDPAAVFAVGDTLSVEGALTNVTLGPDLGVPRFVLNAGTLAGAGNLTVNTAFSWLSGTMSGAGFTRIAPSALGTIAATSASPTLDRLLLNDGALSLGGTAPLSVAPGAIIRNGTGATFSLPGDNDVSGSGAFENQAGALFVKSGGTGTSFVAGSITQLGTLRVLSGTLQLPGILTNEGTVEVGDGAGPEETLEAQGGYRQLGGTTHLVSGTLVGGPVATPTFVEILAGLVIGTGRLEGLVTNAATFAPGDSIGGIEIGGDYVQTAGGRLEAQIAGSAAPGTDYDRLLVTGNATLGGELAASFVGGFEPALGDSFDVVAAGPGAVAGAFATTNLPTLVAAGCVQMGYDPAAVWISTVTCGVGLITWTGQGGTTSWHDGANWSLHRSPIAGDFVRIPDLAGTPVVVYSTGTTSIQDLESDENFAIEGGTLELAGPSVISGALTLSGGALSGAGDLTLSGAFEWSGSAAMNGPGTLTADSTGSWTIPAGATPAVGRTLTLRGTGLNAGSLVVPAGLDLHVDGGSLESVAGSSLTLGGTLAMTGGTLAVDSLASCSVDSLYVGAGSTVTLDGDGSHRALRLDGGFLGGAGDVTFTGSLLWSSGTLAGSGRLIVPAGLAWHIDAAAPGRVLGRVLENGGTCLLTGGAPTLVQLPGGSFRVGAGGQLDLQGDAGFAGDGNLVIQPGGRLVKSAGPGASAIGIPVVALGTIDAYSGTLAFTAPAPFTNQGAVTIGTGAALAANSGYVQAAGSTVLAGGTLSSSAGVTVQSGSLRGSGTVAGNLVNMAQLAPGDSLGAIAVAGNFTQTASGLLNETVGGHTPGSGFDVLVVSGSAQVNGSLVVTLAAGFVPSSQDTFAFLTASAVGGQFALSNLPIDGGGFCLDLEYKPALVRLSTLGIAILRQPDPVVACPLGAALFSVSAGGPGTPVYQWRRNGAVIPGANNDTLVVSPVTAGNAGLYDVVIVTACDSTSSLAVSLAIGFCPDTFFVDASKPPGGNGAAWATAYRDLQSALSAAAATGGFCEVWVARGRYRPDPALQAVSFNLVNKVALYGGFLGTETLREQRNPAANRTVLSGDLAVNDGPNFANNVENSRMVVRATGVDSTAILDGFAVTGGNALGNGAGIAVSSYARAVFRNCAIDSNFAANSGGGFRSDNSSPRLVDCTLRANRASGSGGGLSASGTGAVTIAGGSFTANNTPGSGGAITLSAAVSITGTQFTDNTAQSIGGAINLSGFATSVLSLTDCGFTNNSTTSSGGGVGGAISVGASAGLTALRCTFAGNTCNQSGAGTPNTKGGAIGNLGLTMTLTDCEFTDNAVHFNGSAVANACGGGAVFGPALMDRCTFLRNVTSGAGTAIRGGAVHVTSGVLEIRAGRFVGNLANGPAATPGGAVAVTGATRFLAANCLFDGNSAQGEGGAVYLGGTRRATLAGCTVHGNTSVGAGGGIRVAAAMSGDSVFVSSGILWLNVGGVNGGEPGQVSFASATPPKVSYCDVMGLTGALGGAGNVAVEPLFSDANGPDDIAGTPDDDFTLRMGSPVVDAGDNGSIPAGVETDLAGAPRRMDDPCRVDSGAGSAPIVDMGALEFQFNSCGLDAPGPALAGGVTFVGVPSPNPTTGPAEIRMRLPRDVSVKIEVMDVAGRRIHTLLDAVVPAGERTIRWDGRGDSGQLAHAGLYFVRFRIGSELLTRRVLIRP